MQAKNEISLNDLPDFIIYLLTALINDKDVKRLMCTSRPLYDQLAKVNKQNFYGRFFYFIAFIKQLQKEKENKITSYKKSNKITFFNPQKASLAYKASITEICLHIISFSCLMYLFFTSSSRDNLPSSFYWVLTINITLSLLRFFEFIAQTTRENNQLQAKSLNKQVFEKYVRFIENDPMFKQILHDNDIKTSTANNQLTFGKVNQRFAQIATRLSETIEKLQAFHQSSRGQAITAVNLKSFSKEYRQVIEHFIKQFNESTDNDMTIRMTK